MIKAKYISFYPSYYYNILIMQKNSLLISLMINQLIITNIFLGLFSYWLADIYIVIYI